MIFRIRSSEKTKGSAVLNLKLAIRYIMIRYLQHLLAKIALMGLNVGGVAQGHQPSWVKLVAR